MFFFLIHAMIKKLMLVLESMFFNKVDNYSASAHSRFRFKRSVVHNVWFYWLCT